MSATTLEEVVACDWNGGTWLWAHDWLDKRKFKGSILSRLGRNGFDTVEDFDSRLDIIRGKVHHGWVITVVGDTSGCGWDTTTYFETTEPVVVDGRWDGAVIYDADRDDEEIPAEVADGPHKATWLEVGQR